MTNEEFMGEALKEAKKASAIGEVPIGAIIVKDGEIIGRGHNETIKNNDASAHAEMNAIRNASKNIENYRLTGADLYVTIEPCAMCSGAIIWSRLKTVYFGAYDKKAGCAGSLYDLPEDSRFNHRAVVVPGIREKECAEIISDFFAELRKKNE
ncbi:MAG: tRNA adenosine(34) deaminase TadA [Lactobacillales bacterium]|jgi:tRNA(adenine34) deaminase|nr:tRNA adenosine(34) deaminase TadA [Lactobacillales bacterium]